MGYTCLAHPLLLSDIPTLIGTAAFILETAAAASNKVQGTYNDLNMHIRLEKTWHKTAGQLPDWQLHQSAARIARMNACMHACTYARYGTK